MNKNYFTNAFKKLIQIEGVYSDIEFDYGGKTKYGITEKFLNKIKYFKNIEKLNVNDAKKIYKKYFWNKLNLDKIIDYNISFEIFEASVHCGTFIAAKITQKSINYIYKCLKIKNFLKIDGIIGNKTITAINSLTNYYIKYYIIIFNLLQGQYYLNIIDKNESQSKFLIGWINKRIYLEV